MNLAHPHHLFWLIALAALLGLLAWSLKTKRALMKQLIDADLIEKVFPFAEWKTRASWRAALQVLGTLFIVLALAGPEIGQKLETVTVKGGSVFILFDCSDSMLAEDFKPTRLEKSKRMLAGLLEKMHGNRVGIIAFAGEAYVYCPMTFDLSTAKQFLKSIEPGMIPQPGTHIGSAIRLAVSRMGGEKGSGSIVLLTDGEDHKSDPEGAAKEAKDQDIRIFAIGIGNPDGEPIPVRDASGSVTGYRKNKNGEVVLSRLGEAALAGIATATGGSYFRASDAEQEIDLLADQLKDGGKNLLTQKRNVYENRYQWFLATGLLLWLIAESLAVWTKRGAKGSGRVAGLALLVLLSTLLQGVSVEASAAGFREKMREGGKRYDRGMYSEAAESYNEAQQEKPSDRRANFNRGGALYKMNDWDGAQEEFQKSAMGSDRGLSADSLYNLGNTLFQQGKYKEAAEAYKQDLKLNPYDEDARHNLKLSLQFLRNPPPQQQNKKNQDRKDGKDKQQQDKARAAEQDEQKKEKEENARRVLKGAAGDNGDKPIFRPDPKGKNKKHDDDEDW